MKLMRQFENSLLRQLSVLFVVLLIAGVGFAQSVHLHEELLPGSSARSHCALCVFSHSPAVITVASSAPLPSVASVAPILREAQVRSRLLIPASLIRPPPCLC
jgi:hypothetical protein